MISGAAIICFMVAPEYAFLEIVLETQKSPFILGVLK